MCGIVGMFAPAAAVDAQALKRATDAIAHRGPDGEGHWISADRHVGLGHRRLAIIDVAHGAQPLVNAAQTLVAVVNGEFYDEPRIRAQLIARGHQFQTGSDSEILLHLYAEYGMDFLDHLRGEFAFILYDLQQQRLIAGRDRFGIKPLCYSAANGMLHLASEAKALFAAGVEARWDHAAMAHVSCFQYSAPNQTMFAQVQQLPPGHVLIADAQGHRILPYWDMDFPLEGTPGLTTSFAQQTERVRELLTESIGLRLRTEAARICCHISGGIDSASIAAIASREAGTPLPCFTVAFDHDAYDESAIAQRLAASIGADFYRVHATANDMAGALSDAVYFSEGLAINNHLAAKFLLNRAIAAEGFTIALSGEGSDELFAGYPHFKLDDHAQPAQIAAENMVSSGIQIASGETLPVEDFDRALGYVPSFIRAKAGIGLQLRALMRTDFLDQYPAASVYAGLLADMPIATQLHGRERIHQSTYLWCKYALANYILRTLGDGCEMAHSIEGRVPFLDHPLYAYTRQVPLAHKIHQGVEKHILREAVKPYVTAEIYARRKHPFMAPPLGLLKDGRGSEYLNDCLRSQAFSHLPFFDAAKVARHLDALPGKSAAEHIAAEPGLMLMLTSHLLAQHYGL